MKKLISALTALTLTSALLFTGCTSSNQENSVEPTSSNQESNSDSGSEKFDIGIIQLTEHAALDSACEGFKKALSDNGYVDGKNIDIDFQNAQNDQSNLKTISQKFVTDNKDLILAIATPAAQSVAAETSDIPILITAVTDPAAADLVESNETPGNNITGTSDLTPVDEQIELLTKIVPDAKKIAILYCSGEQNSAFQADLAEQAAANLGIETERKTVTSTNDVAQIVESIVSDFDAIYIPTDNTLASSMPLVTSIAVPAKVPVIVGEQGMVEGGGLASVGINYNNLGYMTGEMAVEILKDGKQPKNMPIRYVTDNDLLINKTTMEDIGITIPEEIMKDAVIIGEQNSIEEDTTGNVIYLQENKQ